MAGNPEFRDWDFQDSGIPKISGLGFSGFRIPELQDFLGFPVFRNPEPHPMITKVIRNILGCKHELLLSRENCYILIFLLDLNHRNIILLFFCLEECEI